MRPNQVGGFFVMASSVTGALRHRCPCGAEYLVALDRSSDPEWQATIGEVARSLGLEPVDGSLLRFVCRHCGREHVRNEEWIVAAESPLPPRAPNQPDR
jgi:hypothetical protein